MEETVIGFGFVEPVLPPQRNPQQEAQLFLQHGTQRRNRLRQPIALEQPRPFDGMRLSIFSATDSDAATSSSYHDQSHLLSSVRPYSTLTSDVASTSGTKKRYRRPPTLVITPENQLEDAEFDRDVVIVRETSSVQDDTATVEENNVWDIAAAHALNAQNKTDAWQQLSSKLKFTRFQLQLWKKILFWEY
ncbi:uncharacterized protein LOC113278253 isoform X2 [Papaver somniferum]|uniref:uncharacterized protein LOC113278253 isoform X2 n=1 Tax=Papaver somniferum TaxID=3469 RepID=UPI000E6FC9AC|nr:uncharacterized protein LOC113278253 isoform X2 [Papaver somniferum]